MAIYTYNGSILAPGAPGIAVDANCCCSTACYLLRSCTQDSNSCNSCDPPIPDKLYITFTSLGGTWSVLNGEQTVNWSSGCTWSATISGFSVSLINATSTWTVTVGSGSCIKTWTLSGTCDPRGSYSASSCTDTTCSGNCSASSSATASVALTTTGSYSAGTGEIIVDNDLSDYVYGDFIEYSSTCYYFVGEVQCPGTPTTMTNWCRYDSCAECTGTSCSCTVQAQNCAVSSSCSPALEQEYTVTISGLTGACAGANGTFTLCYGRSCTGYPTPTWSNNCNWQYCWSASNAIILSWWATPGNWRLLLAYPGVGNTWRGNGPSTLCDPTGTYTYYSGGCTGTATVVVS